MEQASEIASIGLGVRNMMAVVIFQRLLNFTVNQLLLRRVDPEVLGLALLRADLMLSATLFLGREGLRLALVRQPAASSIQFADSITTTTAAAAAAAAAASRARQGLVNMACLSTPVGLLLTLTVAFAYAKLNPDEPEDRRKTALLYCLGGALESLVEPLFILAQANLQTGVRAYAEGSAALVRGVTTYALLVWAGWGVVSFGAAQVSYGLTIALCYLTFFNANPRSCGFASLAEIRPRRLPSSVEGGLAPPVPGGGAAAGADVVPSSWVMDMAPLRLAAHFSLQSVFKHLLTEGDRIVLALGASLYDQGVYVMAQNYGSLAVRVLLQPLEEAARLVFAKLGAELKAAREKAEKQTGPLKGVSQGRADGAGKAEDWVGKAEGLEALLGLLLKAVALLGLVFCCLGPAYVPTLLLVLPGERWATREAESTLCWYCGYIFLLGLNGILEAFLYAVADEAQVLRLTGVHSACSLLFAALAAPCMAHLGTAGIVAANCAVMLVRIAYAARVANQFFAEFKKKSDPDSSAAAVAVGGLRFAGVPDLRVLGAFLLAALATRASESRRLLAAALAAAPSRDLAAVNGPGLRLKLAGAAPHVLFGVGCFVAVAAAVAAFERRALGQLRDLVRASRATREKKMA